MSEEELLEHNEDNMRTQTAQKREFNDKYDALSDEAKFNGMSGILDGSLLQIKD